MGEHGMTPWRAGCAETCTSGSEGGPRKRMRRKPRTAPRPDPYTYLRCWEGVVYFAFVIDAYSRMIVGWQFATHMRTDLVLDALRMGARPARPRRRRRVDSPQRRRRAARAQPVVATPVC
jgi:transposase InsO family protein